MNLDQVLSLLRTVLQVGGGLAVAHGFGTGQTWLDITGGVLALTGLVWGQVHHANNPTTAPLGSIKS